MTTLPTSLENKRDWLPSPGSNIRVHFSQEHSKQNM